MRPQEAAPETGRDFEVSEAGAAPKTESSPQQDAKEAQKALASALEEPAEAAIPQDRFQKEIEGVLSEGLLENYQKMTPDAQKAFQASGEKAAEEIRQELLLRKINGRKVHDKIKDWMKQVPNLNPFFIEQAAKIRTDKLMALVEEEKRRAAERMETERLAA